MKVIAKLEKIVAATGLEMMRLVAVPEAGASDIEIAALAHVLPRSLGKTHEAILRRWNGLNVDIIRVFRAGPSIKKLPGLADHQHPPLSGMPGVIIFANDPSGFQYGEAGTGEILCFDHDGGEVKKLSSSMEEFFDELIFGASAAEFAGQDWHDELAAAGII
jgi:hypothetical protein